jgi:L-alanine-DL-glutamate epimerase-like enolase superfamily enzyme
MTLTAERIDLRLRHTFTIARGSRDVVPSVIITLSKDGITGYGEASPSLRYGETAETVFTFVAELRSEIARSGAGIGDLPAVAQRLTLNDRAAKAGIDIAWHDWTARSKGMPVWQLLSCPAPLPLPTSMTIGIDTPEGVREKVLETEGFDILKIKMGVPDDLRLVDAIRRVTRQRFRVDANEGWTRKEEALEKILALQSLDVELVEQPMPAAMLRDTAWLRERVSVPLIADESVRTEADVPHLRDAFDGINIKLMKCGGLGPARRMAQVAGEQGMKVMLGCMIESSIGITAAAHLSGLAEYADLDGNLLITNDPFVGVGVAGGCLALPDGAGLGISARRGRGAPA